MYMLLTLSLGQKVQIRNIMLHQREAATRKEQNLMIRSVHQAGAIHYTPPESPAFPSKKGWLF
jgi:hypothetical protein